MVLTQGCSNQCPRPVEALQDRDEDWGEATPDRDGDALRADDVRGGEKVVLYANPEDAVEELGFDLLLEQEGQDEDPGV